MVIRNEPQKATESIGNFQIHIHRKLVLPPPYPGPARSCPFRRRIKVIWLWTSRSDLLMVSLGFWTPNARISASAASGASQGCDLKGYISTCEYSDWTSSVVVALRQSPTRDREQLSPTDTSSTTWGHCIAGTFSHRHPLLSSMAKSNDSKTSWKLLV